MSIPTESMIRCRSIRGLLMVLVTVGGCQTARAVDPPPVPSDLVLEAWRAIDRDYYLPLSGEAVWGRSGAVAATGRIDSIDQAHAAIRRMLFWLENPSTRFLTATQAEALFAEVGGQLGSGTGLMELLSVDVDEKDGGIVVVTPVANTPAARSGLRTGDQLIRVEEHSVASMDLASVMSALRGPAGTAVAVTVKRCSRILTVTITREDLPPVEAVSARLITAGGLSIAYLQLSLFSASAPEEVLRAFEQFRNEDVDGYVLDLRNNPGGRLGALQAIAASFMGEVPLARILERDGVRTLSAEGDRVVEEPLAVLVNEGTASAAEILASAVGFHDRGVIVGAKTFGKGLVHGYASLADGSGIMFTAGRIETLDGRDIVAEGIEPDIPVEFGPHPVVESEVEAAGPEDAEFARAVGELGRIVGAG